MSEKVGVYRTGPELAVAVEELRELSARFSQIRVVDRSTAFNTELIEALELRNMLCVAELIAVSALERTETRGAHSREDFPERDDARWLRHTLLTLGTEGRPVSSHASVAITRVKPEERSY